MGNNQQEKKLYKSFEKYCTNDNNIDLLYKDMKNSGKHMDLEFIYKNNYYRVEVKVKTSNFYQALLLIFGNVIKGRNLSLANPNVNYEEIFYGVMIPKKSEKSFKKQWLKIDINDWIVFGETFGVSSVFVFDRENKSLKEYNWDTYLHE